MKVCRALTIAGSDSGGGAGIQADLKTFQELGVYGMSAVTAVTAQNTLGVQAVFAITADAVERQLESVGSDLPPDALKTGMLLNGDMVAAVARSIRRLQSNHVVVDPVMLAKDGSALLADEALETLKKQLFPLAEAVTPNIPEAEALTGLEIRTERQQREAARILCGMGARNVILKGGHAWNLEQSIDLWFDGRNFYELAGRRIDTKHTHGTGCTFAAALTAELAKGKAMGEAVHTAKAFIQAAIEDAIAIGNGIGPTNHWAYRNRMLKKGAES